MRYDPPEFENVEEGIAAAEDILASFDDKDWDAWFAGDSQG